MSAANSYTAEKCNTCGAAMTDEEIEYYEVRCERCEGEWLDMIETWRKGGRNDVLDDLFSAPTATSKPE